MDPLTQLLLQRRLAQPQPQAQPVPATPPNPSSKVPTKVQRFNNAQAIQDAYRQGWSPNPVLLQAKLS